MKRKHRHELWTAVLLVVMTFTACGRGAPHEGDNARSAADRTAAGSAQAVSAQDREAVVQRLRTELALLLKKDADQLPVETPVTELGADDLTLVEWQMAAERAFGVDIAADAVFDSKSGPRKDLTIASMAEIVVRSRPRANAR